MYRRNRQMKKFLQLTILAVISMFILIACGSEGEKESGSDSSGKKYLIGATQILEHPSLDAATEGFEKAIEDAGINAEIDYQSAQNDMNNVAVIADKFVADGVDLIFANSTPSALGAQNATSDIPILFTSVTDAVDANLIESMESPGGNITGVVDLHPDAIEKTVKFIDQYFKDAKVGIIYNAGEQNSVAQMKAIEEVAGGTSLTLLERTVATSADVQQAAMSLAGDIDVFYVFTDNTVVSALDSVVDIANEQKIPFIVGEPDSVELGGFASYGFDYYSIGYRTGEMAAEILKDGKKPSEISAEYPPELKLYINKEAAEAQGIEWNEDWDDAEFIE